MSNVVKFPESGRTAPAPDVENVQRGEVEPEASLSKRVLAGFGRGLRVTVFLVMYWMRMPVKFVCGLISVPMLLAFLFSMYAFPDKTNMIWLFGIFSFTAFAVSWAYDFILMALAPQDMMMSL